MAPLETEETVHGHHVRGREVEWGGEADRMKKAGLGFWPVAGTGVASVAPAMSFAGTIGVIALSTGMGAPIAILIGTLLMTAVGLSFGELNRVFPSAGGFYAYLRQSMGSKTGWWMVWVYFICAPIGTTVPGAIFSMYFHDEWGLPYWLLAVIFTAIVLVLNVRGIGLAAKVMSVLALGQILALLVLGIIVFIWASSNSAVFSSNLADMWSVSLDGVGFAGIVAGVFVGVFLFVGFENSAVLGEEARRGWRTVSLALLGAPLLTGIAYVVLAVLWMAPLTPSQLTTVQDSGAPLNDILEFTGNGSLTALTSIVVVIASIACEMGFLTSMSRVFYDLSRAGSFPGFFGKVNKHGTPMNGMWLVSAILFISILLMTYADTFNTWVAFVALGGSILYIFISLANIVYFRRDWGTRAIFVNKLIPVVTLAAMVYVLVTGVPRYIQVIGIVWALVGLLVMWGIHAAKGNQAFELEYEVVSEVLDDGEVVKSPHST